MRRGGCRGAFWLIIRWAVREGGRKLGDGKFLQVLVWILQPSVGPT